MDIRFNFTERSPKKDYKDNSLNFVCLATVESRHLREVEIVTRSRSGSIYDYEQNF